MPGLILATILLLQLAGVTHAQATANEFLRSNPKFIDSFRDLIQPHVQATVRIRCDGQETCLGTIVGADGWILTKAHDLHGKITCTLADGSTHEARLVGVHEPHDLAMLRIGARLLHVVKFSHSKNTQAGSWVVSVGVTRDPAALGIVSVPPRKVSEAYLGIQLEPAAHGVVIGKLLQNGAALKAGVRTNDLLLSANGRRIDDAEQLQQLLGEMKPGDVLTLRVQRGDQAYVFKAILQSREQGGDQRAEMQNRMGSDLSRRRSGYSVILQHDSVLKPTDCGGPLVDLKGRVIGINISRAGRVETWAIPAEVVQPLILELQSGRWAPREKR